MFSLSHFLNLIGMAGITDTLLQVVYTFLLEVMFTIVYDKTKNIWINVSIHSLFDFGGMLIPTLGYGNFHDLCFWILAVTVGVLCGIQIIIYTLKKLELFIQLEIWHFHFNKRNQISQYLFLII